MAVKMDASVSKGSADLPGDGGSDADASFRQGFARTTSLRGPNKGEAEFGPRLEFNLADSKNFRSEYGYSGARAFFTIACTCRGRVFPWQGMALFFFINCLVGFLTMPIWAYVDNNGVPIRAPSAKSRFYSHRINPKTDLDGRLMDQNNFLVPGQESETIEQTQLNLLWSGTAPTENGVLDPPLVVSFTGAAGTSHRTAIEYKTMGTADTSDDEIVLQGAYWPGCDEQFRCVDVLVPAIPDSWQFPMRYKYLHFIVAFLLVYRAREAYTYFRDARARWETVIWNCWEMHQIMAAHIPRKELVKMAGEHILGFVICLKAFLRRDTQTLADTKKELEKVMKPVDIRGVLDIPTGEEDKKSYHVRSDQYQSKHRIEGWNNEGEAVVQHGHCAACLFVIHRIFEHGILSIKEQGSKYYGPVGGGIFTWGLRRMSAMMQSLCHMHRITTTPFPWVYMLHQRFLVMVYLCIIPFAIRDNLRTGPKQYPTGNGRGTVKYSNFELFAYIVLYSTIIDYAILGLGEIGNQLQNPFGTDVSDLPMETFIQQIQRYLNHSAHSAYNTYHDLDKRLMNLKEDNLSIPKELSVQAVRGSGGAYENNDGGRQDHQLNVETSDEEGDNPATNF